MIKHELLRMKLPRSSMRTDHILPHTGRLGAESSSRDQTFARSNFLLDAGIS